LLRCDHELELAIGEAAQHNLSANAINDEKVRMAA
tara:strand:+ start:1393 stop:1497 length:105 start_codon:yes stop_codon:yes gene_type:complete